MAVIGLTTFLPMYVQGVLDRSALVAGFALTMMVLGWPIGATLATRAFPRFGLRGPLLLGAALLPLGAVLFLLLAPGVSPVVAGIGSVIMGLGMGFLTSSAIILIQDSVGWAERGAATASNVFSRNLGSTLGATALGAVLNIALARYGAAGITPDRIRDLLEHPDGRGRGGGGAGGARPVPPPHLLGHLRGRARHAAAGDPRAAHQASAGGEARRIAAYWRTKRRLQGRPSTRVPEPEV